MATEGPAAYRQKLADSTDERASLRQQTRIRERRIDSICHLIASREHGGMEKHVADLSRWQARNTDAKISVIAHPRYRNALDERVHFVPLNTDRSRHHPTLVWRLANHIRAGEYQIAHGHGSKSAQLLAAVQKYTETRQVITRHNVRHPRDKLASAFAARIAISRAAVANSRLHWEIIPNGITPASTEMKTDLGPVPCALVYMRRLKRESIEPLLQAVAEIPQLRLMVLGDGVERAGLERLSQQLQLGPRVRFAGASDDVGAFMRAASLLIIPLGSEDTPYPLVEALLNRCPVLSCRVGNAEEYLPPAYLLDNLEAAYLAQKLRFALRSERALRDDFTPVFTRAARELTLDTMARAIWRVYTQLLA